ncbi:cAMP-dependent protein kinase type I-alpha regulatory subunit-like [Symsagittifera roscoffensis]|uniref:cAMP-dependent protein kinase type I-alpha regulatory subunit-like n=1 Tax=Symsagittifera roscoffensis TaxID=84072 RepID=UPI00307B2C15
MGKVLSAPREGARNVQRRMSNLGKKKKTDSTEEQNNKHDEDDILEDEPPPPKPQEGPTKGVRRRGAVSAEAVTEEDIANYKKVVIPKTAEEMSALKDSLMKNVLFKYMDEKTREDIFDVIQPKDYQPAQDVIVQGDEGDYFYIIHKGTVDVYVNNNKVGSIPEGGSFGELALIYGTPRAATIRAAGEAPATTATIEQGTPAAEGEGGGATSEQPPESTGVVKTFRLDRESYRMLLMGNTLKKRKMYEEFLKKVPLLESLDSWELLTLADSLESSHYKGGDVIMQQGEEGDCFYIIVQGEAKVYQKKEGQSEEVDVGTLSTSQYFGEIALILNKPRAATVKASSDSLEVVKISKERFERVLGPCQDILKRNLENYNSIVALK